LVTEKRLNESKPTCYGTGASGRKNPNLLIHVLPQSKKIQKKKVSRKVNYKE